MDLWARLEGMVEANTDFAHVDAVVLAIVAFQIQPGEKPQHGGIKLAQVPYRTLVSDNQACELPQEPQGWRDLAHSCFTINHKTVPILDLPEIFLAPVAT